LQGPKYSGENQTIKQNFLSFYIPLGRHLGKASKKKLKSGKNEIFWQESGVKVDYISNSWKFFLENHAKISRFSFNSRLHIKIIHFILINRIKFR